MILTHELTTLTRQNSFDQSIVVILLYADRSSDDGDRSSLKDQPEETTDAGLTAAMTTPDLSSAVKSL